MLITFRAVVLSAALLTGAAGAVERQPVENVKSLLVDAVIYGEAHGYLAGEMGKKTQEMFRTAYPMEIDVEAVAALPQRGCKRLRVTTRQRAVIEPKVKGYKQVDGPDDKTMIFDMNMCEDGRFPREVQQ